MSASDEITTYEELRELIGTPLRPAIDKVGTALQPLHREWLAASPFCLVATSDADGRCDVSPKGDPAGMAYVVDDTTIAIPERPGNKRADGYLNVLANPHAGLVFVIPGRGDTLRINGRARLIRDADYFEAMVVKGHRPILALELAIEEVYFHCPKAFMRSGLWKSETWAPDALPTRAHIAKQLERPEASIEELERYYGPEYAKKLYASSS